MPPPWFKFFRVDCASPMLYALEARVGPAALAHIIKLYAALPADGDISRTGDLTGVPDVAIERWAQWTGKGGDFAAALRATEWITGNNRLYLWEERQRAIFDKAERDSIRPSGWRRPRAEHSAVHRTGPARSTARSTAPTPRGVLLDLNSGSGIPDPEDHREPRAVHSAEHSADPALSTALCTARDEQRAAELAAAAAAIARDRGLPEPPVDVGSLEHARWMFANPEIVTEARRRLDGEVV